MKKNFVVTVVAIISAILFSINAQAQGKQQRYIDVVGSCEMEIVPDEIHFIISIQEYFEEEFDGFSKPEQYKTKVKIADIEKDLRKVLRNAGVEDRNIRVEEVGDYWRQRGMDFLISKNFDITLNDFSKIDKIISTVDTKGIRSMRVGELKNKNMKQYHEQGKIEALKAAKKKAEYLLSSIGEELGEVIFIEEPREGTDDYIVMRKAEMSNSALDGLGLIGSPASQADEFRVISLRYTLKVRFSIADKMGGMKKMDNDSDDYVSQSKMNRKTRR